MKGRGILASLLITVIPKKYSTKMIAAYANATIERPTNAETIRPRAFSMFPESPPEMIH